VHNILGTGRPPVWMTLAAVVAVKCHWMKVIFHTVQVLLPINGRAIACIVGSNPPQRICLRTDCNHGKSKLAHFRTEIRN
jgi:hypothetical protein